MPKVQFLASSKLADQTPSKGGISEVFLGREKARRCMANLQGVQPTREYARQLLLVHQLFFGELSCEKPSAFAKS